SSCGTFCFFFQAEDGIRDRNVTGVQTCALPISAMDGILAAFFSGSAASALISGIFALVQARLRRGKQHSDTEQALVDGMKFILQIGRASCRERVQIAVVGGS